MVPSFEESIPVEVVNAARAVALELILVGNAAAARPKDLAVLPVLEQTAHVLAAIQQEKGKPGRKKPAARGRSGKAKR